MLEHIDRSWRVAATGLCFSTFGLGGLALRMVAFPLLRMGVWRPQHRTRLARDMIRLSFRIFVGLMCRVGVMRLEVRHAERLERRGLLVLANHPTLVDVVLLMSLVRNADCVVKASLLRNPFTRGPVETAGFICNDTGPGLVDDAIASLKAGSNLIIFPEGTRTRPGRPLQLQRGAANVAVRGALDVTPVVIRCDIPWLTKGAAWWRVPLRRANVVVEVQEDLPIRPFLEDPPALAARRLTEHLTHHFSKELARVDAAA
jgi:1-acyl-sn-glycerol-3-phosphate acyltransferase